MSRTCSREPQSEHKRNTQRQNPLPREGVPVTRASASVFRTEQSSATHPCAWESESLSFSLSLCH